MIKCAAHTDVGRKRSTNQDYYLLDPDCGLYLLADGMGGHAAGDTAARLAVTAVDDFVRVADYPREMTWPFGYDIQQPYETNVLSTALRLANLKVCQTAEEVEDYAGMGSTLVAVWVRDSHFYYSHLGDSRLYRMRNGELRQLTVDHSLVQEQIKKGLLSPQEARHHPMRNVVTRAIGVRENFEVEVRREEFVQGDRLLMCCDGLSDKLEDQEIENLFGSNLDLQRICEELVSAANAAGGEDNITVVVLQFIEE